MAHLPRDEITRFISNKGPGIVPQISNDYLLGLVNKFFILKNDIWLNHMIAFLFLALESNAKNFLTSISIINKAEHLFNDTPLKGKKIFSRRQNSIKFGLESDLVVLCIRCERINGICVPMNKTASAAAH